MKNFIIIRTQKGRKYANKIARSIHWINENKYPREEFNVHVMTITEFMGANRLEWIPSDTVIHPRCANPRTDWTIRLREWEEAGFKVRNSVDCIELTSNKLACSLHLQGKVDHPKTWEYRKDMSNIEFHTMMESVRDSGINLDFLIAKPLTSLEQGANVKKVVWEDDMVFSDIREQFDSVPGKKIVIQEFIPYTALHRVIVIGGRALPYTFEDRPERHQPGDWKVSCCLNKTTMELCDAPPPRLLQLAEQTQLEVGGVINFIDIFEMPWRQDENVPRDGYGNFTNAEINTACSLNIHERLAQEAGRTDWNIHYRIARELVKQVMEA